MGQNCAAVPRRGKVGIARTTGIPRTRCEQNDLTPRRCTIFTVFFEVWPAEGRREAYLNYAVRLKPELEKMDGFISVERFQGIHKSARPTVFSDRNYPESSSDDRRRRLTIRD